MARKTKSLSDRTIGAAITAWRQRDKAIVSAANREQIADILDAVTDPFSVETLSELSKHLPEKTISELAHPKADDAIKARKSLAAGLRKGRAIDVELFDGDGLILLIRANNQDCSTLWRHRYKHPITGKRTNIGLGVYDVVTLEDAREKRRENLKLLDAGIDPKTHRDTQHAERAAELHNTFSKVAALWLDNYRAAIAEDTATDIWRSLERHVFPVIGEEPITNVHMRHMDAILEPIQARKNYETVKRLCTRMIQIFDFAVRRHIISGHGFAGLNKDYKPPKDERGKKHQPSIPPAQLCSFMTSLATAAIRQETRCLIEWQLHTLTRPAEAACAKWEEIDLVSKLWTIPASRTKMNRTHRVHLSDEAIILLKAMAPISTHREYVFPSITDPRKPMNPQTANMAIKRMGFGGLLVAHGLRSIGSTYLHRSLEFQERVVESCLGHVIGTEVERAYHRDEVFDPESKFEVKRKQAFAYWSAYIEQEAAGCSVVAVEKRKII